MKVIELDDASSTFQGSDFSDDDSTRQVPSRSVSAPVTNRYNFQKARVRRIVSGLSKIGLNDTTRHTNGTEDDETALSVGTLPTDKGLSNTLAGSTVVNYLAASYILLPWAFSQGGTLLGTILLALVMLQTYISSTCILETCARAEAINSIVSDEETGQKLPRNYVVKIRSRVFEISVLTKTFLGPYLGRFFSFTTLADLYGITWAFCSVFISSFHDFYPIVPNEDHDRAIYLVVFLSVAAPLACTSVMDQIYIQMLFLVARLVMVLLMLVTVFVGFVNTERSYFLNQEGPIDDVELFHWSKIVQTTMTCIFATAYQFSVPTLAGASQSKRKLRNVFAFATSFGYFSNVILAVLLAKYFGKNQPASSNLNWSFFHGGDPDHSSMWAKFVSGYILCFAALDGVVVYSLIAVSLGEILMGAFLEEKAHDVNWTTRMAFRLLGSIPQAIGVMFVSDLGIIANYAGIFTILSYTVCPALLAITSKCHFQRQGLPAETLYSSKLLTSKFSCVVLIIVSLVLIIAVIFQSAI